MLYLASRSPRRRELLDQLGLAHALVAADVDETPLPGEDPMDYVERMALGQGARRAPDVTTAHPVLGADTAVVCDDRILGKPADADDALAMLRLLSGREHRVLTGIALLGQARADRGQRDAGAVSPHHASEAAAYWASGEPSDKAGAYAIQGRGAPCSWSTSVAVTPVLWVCRCSRPRRCFEV